MEQVEVLREAFVALLGAGETEEAVCLMRSIEAAPNGQRQLSDMLALANAGGPEYMWYYGNTKWSTSRGDVDALSWFKRAADMGWPPAVSFMEAEFKGEAAAVGCDEPPQWSVAADRFLKAGIAIKRSMISGLSRASMTLNEGFGDCGMAPRPGA
jgi:hypothetical protein